KYVTQHAAKSFRLTLPSPFRTDSASSIAGFAQDVKQELPRLPAMLQYCSTFGPVVRILRFVATQAQFTEPAPTPLPSPGVGPLFGGRVAPQRGEFDLQLVHASTLASDFRTLDR